MFQRSSSNVLKRTVEDEELTGCHMGGNPEAILKIRN